MLKSRKKPDDYLNRMKRYGLVYDKCLKQINETKSSTERYSRRNRNPIKKVEKNDKKVEKKKQLNDYQKFIKTESKRGKYREQSPKSRMSAIAEAWKTRKEPSKKKKKTKKKQE